MNMQDEFSPKALAVAEAELREEYHREEVDRIKILLRTNALQWVRFKRFWKLIQAAFGELFA